MELSKNIKSDFQANELIMIWASFIEKGLFLIAILKDYDEESTIYNNVYKT